MRQLSVCLLLLLSLALCLPASAARSYELIERDGQGWVVGAPVSVTPSAIDDTRTHAHMLLRGDGRYETLRLSKEAVTTVDGQTVRGMPLGQFRHIAEMATLDGLLGLYAIKDDHELVVAGNNVTLVAHPRFGSTIDQPIEDADLGPTAALIEYGSEGVRIRPNHLRVVDAVIHHRELHPELYGPNGDLIGGQERVTEMPQFQTEEELGQAIAQRLGLSGYTGEFPQPGSDSGANLPGGGHLKLPSSTLAGKDEETFGLGLLQGAAHALETIMKQDKAAGVANVILLGPVVFGLAGLYDMAWEETVWVRGAVSKVADFSVSIVKGAVESVVIEVVDDTSDENTGDSAGESTTTGESGSNPDGGTTPSPDGTDDANTPTRLDAEALGFDEATTSAIIRILKHGKLTEAEWRKQLVGWVTPQETHTDPTPEDASSSTGTMDSPDWTTPTDDEPGTGDPEGQSIDYYRLTAPIDPVRYLSYYEMY